MAKTPPDVFDYPKLLSAPVRRAAYSDRTAWLMASMSELAYWQFEGSDKMLDVVADLVSEARGDGETEKNEIAAARDVKKHLEKYLKNLGVSSEHSYAALEAYLKSAGFVLDNTYNVAGTQGFMCHRSGDAQHGGMRVLAFRGTEPNFEDIKADLKATLVPADGGDGSQLVHQGFQDAFNSVRTLVEADLAKNPDLPLYVGGHSLGGGISIHATWSIAANSLVF